jgi:hypothetical protein
VSTSRAEAVGPTLTRGTNMAWQVEVPANKRIKRTR